MTRDRWAPERTQPNKNSIVTSHAAPFDRLTSDTIGSARESMSHQLPTITVVTASLNAQPFLSYTAASVLSQTLPGVQWIVVDGASCNGTVGWFQQVYGDKEDVVFISEPDQGVYHAWNKAIPYIKGDWVIFLGAGDKLKSPDVLATCAAWLAATPDQFNVAYGFVEYICDPAQLSGTPSKARWEGIDGTWSWCRPVMPNHQGVFHRATFIRDNAGFDVSYLIAADAALLLPELMTRGALEMPVTVTLRLENGLSLDIQNRTLVLREFMRINGGVGLRYRRMPYQCLAYVYHWLKARKAEFVMGLETVPSLFAGSSARQPKDSD